MDLLERCRKVKVILCDVDGVLTDGRLFFDNQGIESKAFHVRDGMAVQLWRRAGRRMAWITQRSSRIVRMRAAELGVDLLRQGVNDKSSASLEALAELGYSPDQAAYLGDDLPDLPILREVVLGAAVADAAEEVRAAADYVTHAPGGGGALRELVELILKSGPEWDSVISPYQGRRIPTGER
ncbi:MAG: HAD hydrolase family protein [Thermogutta sp.]|nr:HAD hydrolase family protein [Thermogutta sp.]